MFMSAQPMPSEDDFASVLTSSASSASSISELALFVFDHDDTLFPSTWLRGVQGVMSPTSIKSRFPDIEKPVYDLISTAKTLGDIAVVTLACEHWVESCIEDYLPGLSCHDLSILSALVFKIHDKTLDFTARCIYRKEQAMRETVKRFREEHPQQNISLVSIGDSDIERTAIKRLYDLPNVTIHSIKLISRPSTYQLADQLAGLKTLLPLMVNQHKPLDIEISPIDIPQQFISLLQRFRS